jgi:hypothetical protein
MVQRVTVEHPLAMRRENQYGHPEAQCEVVYPSTADNSIGPKTR